VRPNFQLIAVFVLGTAFGIVGMRLADTAAVAEDADASPMLAKVVQVNHGDEFEVMWRPPVPMRFNVRLNRVDTPFKDQSGGKEATEELADLIYGKQVRIEFEDPDKPYQDRSERLIAYAHIDGKNVGVEMIRSGQAEFFTKYGEGKYAEAMKAAEDQAKAAKRGRWAEQ
jgi:endonuclease YncB( thermonuclease family)